MGARGRRGLGVGNPVNVWGTELRMDNVWHLFEKHPWQGKLRKTTRKKRAFARLQLIGLC